MEHIAARPAMTRDEVAKAFGVSLSTVDRLTKAGTLAAIRLAGVRRVAYSPVEIERHLRGLRSGV